MALASIFIAFLFAALISTGKTQTGSCRKTVDCICTYDDDWRIDLTPIAQSQFGPAPGPTYDYYYSYWPCYDGSVENVACNAAVIQADDLSYPTWCYSCGTAATNDFGTDSNGNVYIQYNGGDDGRSSKVVLQCSPNDEGTLNALGEQVPESKEYDFTFSSKYACPLSPGAPPPDKPNGSSSVSVSVSPGTIMCIIFIIVLTVYFVGGVLLMKFYKGAEGRELVPNYHLWAAIPGLIKDGVKFFIGLFPCGGNVTVSSAGKYENL
ncbi:uncharacterized protein LOC134190045 [Corticium candelabrum]|uniref:uncharacterized protein LOC134190045 n=1 Tax=Corticium candelabrum TaxID=121492 RepID=UPI002E25E0AA|nr:uncharacterized protein LOC134190045 [Corticium candelabrum]